MQYFLKNYLFRKLMIILFEWSLLFLDGKLEPTTRHLTIPVLPNVRIFVDTTDYVIEHHQNLKNGDLLDAI